jgi:putative phage-type endonuclease
MTSRKKFLADRRSGIGGSDVAALVGADPKKGPLDLFLEKMGQAKELPEDLPVLERGRMLEPIVAKKYQKDTGRKLVRVKEMLRHPKYPFVVGNVDRGFYLDEIRRAAGQLSPLELKTMMVPVFIAAQRDGLPERFGTQLQWYMQPGLMESPTGAFGVFSAEYWVLIRFDHEADNILQRSLFQAAQTFYNDHILTEKPPSDTGWRVPSALVKAQTEVIELAETPELRAAIDAYAEARDLAKTGEDLQKQARGQMIELLGPSRGALRIGNDTLHFSARQKTSFDKKALLAARPIDRQKLFGLMAKTMDPTLAGPKILQAILEKEDVTIDLAQFEKRGAPYDELRLYLRGDDNDKEKE